MEKKELIKNLRYENSKIDIKMSEKLKNTKIPKKDEFLYQTKRISSIPKLISILSCFLFCFFCVAIMFSQKKLEISNGITSYIMEINPSICITTDKNDNIINVIALNDDANAIVLDNELENIEGQKFDFCVKKLIGVIKKNGYFDNYDDKIKIYAFSDSNERQHNSLDHFEKIIKEKIDEFGYDIPFEKHRIGMDDFKEKIGFEEDYKTLDDMQDFFEKREKCFIPPR